MTDDKLIKSLESVIHDQQITIEEQRRHLEKREKLLVRLVGKEFNQYIENPELLNERGNV